MVFIFSHGFTRVKDILDRPDGGKGPDKSFETGQCLMGEENAT
jgi:hypothetical protein